MKMSKVLNEAAAAVSRVDYDPDVDDTSRKTGAMSISSKRLARAANRMAQRRSGDFELNEAEKEAQAKRQAALKQAEQAAMEKRLMEAAQVNVSRFNQLLMTTHGPAHDPIEADEWDDFTLWMDEEGLFGVLEFDDYVEVWGQYRTTETYLRLAESQKRSIEERLENGLWDSDEEFAAMEKRRDELETTLAGKRRLRFDAADDEMMTAAALDPGRSSGEGAAALHTLTAEEAAALEEQEFDEMEA